MRNSNRTLVPAPARVMLSVVLLLVIAGCEGPPSEEVAPGGGSPTPAVIEETLAQQVELAGTRDTATMAPSPCPGVAADAEEREIAVSYRDGPRGADDAHRHADVIVHGVVSRIEPSDFGADQEFFGFLDITIEVEDVVHGPAETTVTFVRATCDKQAARIVAAEGTVHLSVGQTVTAFLRRDAGSGQYFALNDAGIFIRDGDGYVDTGREATWVSEIEAGTKQQLEARAAAST